MKDPQDEKSRLEQQIRALQARLQQLEASTLEPTSASIPPETYLERLLQDRSVKYLGASHDNVTITGDGNQVWVFPRAQVSASLLRIYNRYLVRQSSRLPLNWVKSEFAELDRAEQPLSLQVVFTPLDVRPWAAERADFDPTGDLRRLQGLRLERGEGVGADRLPALQALADAEARQFVLLGAPGSGKSTLVDYLTLCLAGEQNKRLPQDFPAGLVVRLQLRAAASHIPVESACGEPRMLWQTLEEDLKQALGRTSALPTLEALQAALSEQGGWVLLDGLDEVPEAGRRRKCLLEAIQAWVELLPRCRFLLTARPYVYTEKEWRLPGFHTLVLAPFDLEQIQSFARQWFQAVAPLLRWGVGDAEAREQELLQAVKSQNYLLDLASRPLLLTLMAGLVTYNVRMPENRANLYEEAVELLLSRWQEGHLALENGQPITEPAFAQVLKMDRPSLRKAVEELAWSIHCQQRQSASGQQEAVENLAADIPLGEILRVFSHHTSETLSPQLLVRYLEERAGLLVGRGPEIFAFPHRSFQEYLAASYLSETEEDFGGKLSDLLQQDLTWWREVFLLGAASLKKLPLALLLINRLFPSDRPERKVSDLQWRLAALAGEAAVELRLAQEAPGNDYFERELKRIVAWLQALVRRHALPPAERLAAGDALGRLGDPRTGVAVRTTAAGEVPDLDWVEIPAGSFLMGSAEDDQQAWGDERPQHTFVLERYWIARYPITNAQFRPFWEAGGYEQEQWWTPEGWAWRQGAEPDFTPLRNLYDKDDVKSYQDWVLGRIDRSQPRWWEDRRWGAPNRPVVGVSWYEAAAYAKWLDARLRQAGESFPPGYAVRLPNEPEWEKAARGPQGWRWAWGDTWKEGRANTGSAGLRETSPVGLFPAGANRLYDMTGNTWEWTVSKWGDDLIHVSYPYPYDAGDGREAPGGAEARVVRGGSWNDEDRNARCASRGRDLPASFNADLGFRVVLSLALPGF